MSLRIAGSVETSLRIAASFVASCAAAACASTSPALPGGDGGPHEPAPDGGVQTAPAVEQRTAAYGSNAAQTLDLYTPSPAPAAPIPVVVLAHGGLWQGGDKSALFALCEMIVKQSGYKFACASMGYRLSQDIGGACSAPGKDTYREQINDMAAAYAWLGSNASMYGLDKERMFVGGHSAGGHLAHELNLRFGELMKSACSSPEGCPAPQGAVGIEGIYDIAMWDAYDMARWNGQFSCATRKAFGAPPPSEPYCVDSAWGRPCWEMGSPNSLAKNSTALGIKPAGGALIIHSPGDDWVDLQEATAFGASMSAAFPDKSVIVDTSGGCATGQHDELLSEASLADCVVRFMASGGTSL